MFSALIDDDVAGNRRQVITGIKQEADTQKICPRARTWCRQVLLILKMAKTENNKARWVQGLKRFQNPVGVEIISGQGESIEEVEERTRRSRRW